MGTGKHLLKRSMEAAARFSSAARSAPESFFLLALFILAAIAAKRTGAMPGSGTGPVGDAATAFFCAGLYGCLGYLYLRVSPGQGSARGILRMLGICLTLAVISTCGSMFLLAPASWDKFFYFRFFAFPAFTGFWCAALMPRITLELLRALRTSRAAATLRPLAVLLSAAAVLVTGSDLAMQFGDVSVPGIREGIIQKNAWAASISILFALCALVFAVTRRVGASLLLVAPFFAVLGLSTIAKLKYMHSPVVPLDLLSLREFLPFFRTFFGDGVFAASVCGLTAWIVSLLALGRATPRRVRPASRWFIGALSLGFLLAVPALILFSPRMELDRRIGAPAVWNTNLRDSVRTSGFLLSFLSEIPASFIAAPAGYSPETVTAAIRRFQKYAAPSADRGRGRRVNLIVYMVESLMDPEDLGWRYTADPIPNLRALWRTGTAGNCIVPGQYSGSADSEFEALTGMTLSFLPERSLPYRQFVRNPTPSLPAALKRLGYRTFAVQADPKGFYNRVQAYAQMGFDEVFWLNEAPGVERARDPFWPSDNAIVDAILRESRRKQPYFAFAFPSSTHSPYNKGFHGNSDLDVAGPLPEGASAEVKGYINALMEADRAIGRLIGHFRGRPDPTVIVVVGDHLPPLSDGALQQFNADLPYLSSAAREWKPRSTPLLVWANFDLPRETVRFSMNALPSYLLEKIGIAPRGFLAVTDAVRLKFPILSGRHLQGIDSSVHDLDSIPGDDKTLVDDYRLIQYDLLIGKRHALRPAAGN